MWATLNRVSKVLRRGLASSAGTKPAGALRDIDPSRLVVERTRQPKRKLPKEELKFGATFTDHMLEIDWDKNNEGWQAPRIIPYGNLTLSPAATSLHYALQCFEGLKAYVDEQNQIRLFRPEQNMARLNNSARRLQLPTFDGTKFLQCIKELLRVDKEWIPKGFGYSLYIRPTLISTYPYVGVSAPHTAKLYVILSPVGPYYPTGFAPVKLYADTVHVRAWPGGTGDAKIGSNYAPGILPASEAMSKGYSQVLWLFPQKDGTMQVTEVGTMNIFFLIKDKRDPSKASLVTAPLDGTILPGITRDSVLQLVRQWGQFAVQERALTIEEVAEAAESNRLVEAFGAGTAAIVSPVKGFSYKGKDYAVPLDPADPKQQAGPLTRRLAETIMNIQYGKISHPWSVVV